VTDTQLLNWIESQGTPRRKWIARPSGLGRGYRIHQVTAGEARLYGEKRCCKTIREAIEKAVALQLDEEQKRAAELLKNTCRRGSSPESHARPCGLIGKADQCACGCTAKVHCIGGPLAERREPPDELPDSWKNIRYLKQRQERVDWAREVVVHPDCPCWATGRYVWVDGCPGHPRESMT
jgi:hypothetical protein